MLKLFSSDGCPIDIAETAEEYCMKRLPTVEQRRFAEHLPRCSDCASAVKEAGEFIRAITNALRMLEARGTTVD